MGSDDVQIKFRGPPALKKAIERAAELDMSARTVTAWLVSAALQKLKEQGIPIEGVAQGLAGSKPVPRKRSGGK